MSREAENSRIVHRHMGEEWYIVVVEYLVERCVMDSADFSRPIDLKKIRVKDAFWGREQELVRTEVIPYQWEALNDRVKDAAPSYCMRNFKTAGRMMREKKSKGAAFKEPSFTFRGWEMLPEDPKNPDPDSFYGFLFQDSDFSKWIEAVGYSLINHPDAALEQTADEAIDIVCAAQAENGYLDTYYIINGMDRIFTNLRDHHELYCFGHLTEGAIAYFQATGKDKLLNAAKRYADFIFSKFGPEEGKLKGYPGHEIAEMALAKLYEVTGEEKYLQLGKFFLDMRGTRPYYFDAEEKSRNAYEGRPYREPNPEEVRHFYHQAFAPVREQAEAVGHAVRAVYLYSGMADVARLTGDEAMFAACEKLWENITEKKLYITGGIGGTHVGESFSHEYDLPNDTAYSETCAAIGLAFFARRMLEIKADNKYADVMEQALYNTVLAGMALDGKSFFYVNPLSVVPEDCKKDARKFHVKSVRQKWFGCACCPPNIARIVSSVGAYAYTEKEDTLFTHLYMGSEMQFTLNGTEAVLSMESNFPWEGKVKASLRMAETAEGTLAFRLPGWCKQYTYQAPEGVAAEVKDGYLYLTGTWKDGDAVSLDFPMEVRCIVANTQVREDMGKVAFTRGPITYCLEEVDNGKDLHLLKVDRSKLSQILVEKNTELGHEICVLKVPGMREAKSAFTSLYAEYVPGSTEDVTLTFVPYYAWNNRGEGEMRVWVE